MPTSKIVNRAFELLCETKRNSLFGVDHHSEFTADGRTHAQQVAVTTINQKYYNIGVLGDCVDTKGNLIYIVQLACKCALRFSIHPAGVFAFSRVPMLRSCDCKYAKPIILRPEQLKLL